MCGRMLGAGERVAVLLTIGVAAQNVLLRDKVLDAAIQISYDVIVMLCLDSLPGAPIV
jgi:hypothetical protein